MIFILKISVLLLHESLVMGELGICKHFNPATKEACDLVVVVGCCIAFIFYCFVQFIMCFTVAPLYKSKGGVQRLWTRFTSPQAVCARLKCLLLSGCHLLLYIYISFVVLYINQAVVFLVCFIFTIFYVGNLYSLLCGMTFTQLVNYSFYVTISLDDRHLNETESNHISIYFEYEKMIPK